MPKIVEKTRRLTKEQREKVTELEWVAGTLARREVNKRFAGNVAAYEDLKQVAMYGVACAICDWVPEGGKTESSYAWDRARAYIGHYMRDKSRTVKIPRAVQTLYYRYCELRFVRYHEVEEFARGSKRTVIEAYCHILGCDKEQLLEAMRVGVSTPFDYHAEAYQVLNESYLYNDTQRQALQIVAEYVTEEEMKLCIRYFESKRMSSKKQRQVKSILERVKEKLTEENLYDIDMFMLE